MSKSSSPAPTGMPVCPCVARLWPEVAAVLGALDHMEGSDGWGGSFSEGLAMPLSERMCCRDLGSSSQPEETDNGTLSSATLTKVKNRPCGTSSQHQLIFHTQAPCRTLEHRKEGEGWRTRLE